MGTSTDNLAQFVRKYGTDKESELIYLIRQNILDSSNTEERKLKLEESLEVVLDQLLTRKYNLLYHHEKLPRTLHDVSAFIKSLRYNFSTLL